MFTSPAHFGARQKNYLDWIVDADLVKITEQLLRPFDAGALRDDPPAAAAPTNLRLIPRRVRDQARTRP